MDSFPDMEPVCCSMSGSNSCFLTCIQISQEAGKAVWYSHLLKNFLQFVVIHTVKCFDIFNKEVDAFLELSCLFHHPTDVGNLISRSSAFSKSSLNIRRLSVRLLLKRLIEEINTLLLKAGHSPGDFSKTEDPFTLLPHCISLSILPFDFRTLVSPCFSLNYKRTWHPDPNKMVILRY